MKYLSVCSGIEAATVAWHSLGWEPLAFSEIEKFPRKVLAHHYPNVPLHGDFTVLREQEWIKDADILVGGTPCQAFSVAGLRNSLDDDRGNLTLEFVRLADAIDNLRRTGTIIVWENVPGVLSVKDNAFGCFLGALVGNDDPIVPTGGKWTNAGMVMGPKRSAAWRILDAQYFGVAQRRRRVFVVASARDDFDPAKVLFEREGLRRDTPPRREAGERLADSLTVGANQYSGFNGEPVEANNPEVAQCFDRQRSDEYGEANIASTMSARDYKSASDLVAQPIAFNSKDYGSDATTDMSPTLRSLGAYGANGGGSMAVAQPIPLDTMNIIERPSDKRRANRIGRGYGEAGDPMFTITKGHSHAVAQPFSIMPMNSGKDYKARETDVSQPIMAAGPSGGNQGGDYVVQAITQFGEIAGTLSARHDSSPCADRGQNMVNQSMAVRRLTPVECERLQGFPDDYTNISGAADGPRYKALGNSMAVPVMAWLGKKIANEHR
jgi:DNA (cytosine-5)-methyltransferase 1